MKPYLSIVMGIGGNTSNGVLERFAASTAVTVSLVEKFGLTTEIVVVIWNAKDLHIKLGDVMSLACPVRVIYTGDLHSKVPNPYGFKYFEWYPKNIGIRRSRGEFVLSTNPDDIFSVELISHIAERKLKHGYFYRVNRHDRRNGQTFRICYPTGGHSPDESEEQIRKPCSPLAAPWSEDMLHYSAAGDFTLMSKNDWFMIHGNPEREYNDSVDGQTLYLAHLKGMKQIVLPYPIYHPDHERTLNFSPNSQEIIAGKWNDNTPFTQENGEDWGFAGMEFEETTL
jgi:hypothetical protein